MRMEWGYRYWVIADGRLRSPYFKAVWKPGTNETFGCPKMPRHERNQQRQGVPLDLFAESRKHPSSDCACGIRAQPTWANLWDYFNAVDPKVPGNWSIIRGALPLAAGRVRLWGNMADPVPGMGDQSGTLRAQFASIDGTVYLQDATSAQHNEIAQHYGVGTGDLEFT